MGSGSAPHESGHETKLYAVFLQELILYFGADEAAHEKRSTDNFLECR
jgi:hypothetical protein